jgi:uncharacterized protein YjbK
LIESEYKFLLDESTFDNLLKNLELDEGGPILQLNYYYDSSNLDLFRRNITFRIRQKSGCLKEEVKSLINKSGHLNVKKEFERTIDRLPLAVDLSVHSYPELVSVGEVVFLLGMLVTERYTNTKFPGLTICLDRSQYLGLVDYELEVEFDEGYHDDCMRILSKIGIAHVKKGSLGKNARFMHALKDLGLHGSGKYTPMVAY